MNGTTIIIIGLIAVIIVMLFVFYAVAGKIDELRSEVIAGSVRTSKQFQQLDGRIDTMSDIYGRLCEPLDNMHSDIFELSEMMEDTHCKMLYAYNEVEKMKFNAKHAKKEALPASTTFTKDSVLIAKDAEKENEQH